MNSRPYKIPNCPTCGKNLLREMIDISPKNDLKKYCEQHCPKHKWQSNYDWPWHCGKCGKDYENYLEGLLTQNKILYIHK